jgi:hypothetical protein
LPLNISALPDEAAHRVLWVVVEIVCAPARLTASARNKVCTIGGRSLGTNAHIFLLLKKSGQPFYV